MAPMAAEFVRGIKEWQAWRLVWPLWLGLVVCLAPGLFVPRQLSPIDDAQQLRRDAPVVAPHGDSRLSQSFTPGRDPLAAVALYVVDLPQQPVRLLFEIHDGSSQLVSERITLAGLTPPTSFLVRFNELHNVAGKQLTLVLRGESQSADDAIVLGGTSWNSYPGGELAPDGADAIGDLAFVAYSGATLRDLLLDGFAAAGAYLKPLALSLLLWLACTITLWLVLWPPPSEHAAILTAAASCSLLLVPLVLLATSLVGARFSPLLLGAAALAAAAWRRPKLSTLKGIGAQRIIRAATVALVAAFVLVVQCGLIRDLPTPLYVDSVHHVEISSLIAATGRAPAQFPGSQTPFFYHFGVHALAASLTQLDGSLRVDTSLLVLGPVLLTGCALGLYSLTRLAGGGHWAGLAAMVLTTFAFAMPTQLLDWGKYPLLFVVTTGPGVLVLALKSTRRSAELLVAGLLLGGSVLAHTRSLVVWGMVLAVALVVMVWRTRDLRATGRAFARLAPGIALVVIVWLLPAWWRWRQSGLPGAATDAIAAGGSPSTRALYQYGPQEVVWIGALALGFLALGGRALAVRLAIIASVVFLTLAAIVPLPFLPGQRALDPQFAQAASAVPLVLGLALGVVAVQQFSQRLAGIPLWLPALAVAVLAIYSVTGRQSAPGLCCRITAPDDLAVIHALAESTPAASIVAIAAARRTDGQATGVDAGYWVEVLARRKTTVPSLLYGFADAGAQAATTWRALDVDRLIRNGGELCPLGIDYVYLGQRSESFERPTLENNPHLALAFAHGASALYEVIGCEP